jgi:hypothetical protein
MGFTWMIPPADYQRPLDPPPRDRPPPKLDGRLVEREDEERLDEERLEEDPPPKSDDLPDVLDSELSSSSRRGSGSRGMTFVRSSSSPHAGQE